MKTSHRSPNRLIICAVILCTSLSSCIDKNKEIKLITIGGSWKTNPALQFDFNMADANTPKNVIFIVRNNNDYPYSNLRFFVNLKKNNKKIETDTLNFMMAEPNGKWLGRGFGETKEISLFYKKNYTFPGNGKYSIEIKNAMRQDPLPGIEDVGIQIEKVKR